MCFQFPEAGLLTLGIGITMLTAGADLSIVAVANPDGYGKRNYSAAVYAGRAYGQRSLELASALPGFLRQ